MSSNDNHQELIQAEKDIEDIEGSLQKARGDKATKEKELSREEDRLDQLIMDRNKIKKELGQLKLQFDENEEENKKKDQISIIMKSEIDNLEGKKEQLENELDAVERRKIFIKRKMKSGDNPQELIQADGDIRSGRNRLQTIRGDKATKEKELSREEDRLDQLIMDRNKIKKELGQLKLQFDENEEEIKKKEQKIDEHNEEIKKMEDDIEQYEYDLKEAERKKALIERNKN